jgi:hypothetical protein
MWQAESFQALRDALVRKASRYGSLGSAYLVAVHANHPFACRGDAEVALFGSRFHETHSSLQDRAITPDAHGFWTGPVGANHTRVSGALVVRSLYPWALEPTHLCLYHNPWAAFPLSWSTPRVRQAFMASEGIRYEGGEPLPSLFNLPDGWPGADDLPHHR